MNLDTLKHEIDLYLVEQDFVVFRGHARMVSSFPVVYWDCEKYPDYKMFLDVAKAVEARIVAVNPMELAGDQLDEIMETLEITEMPREDFRTVERRLTELRAYEGFTCSIELSFDHGGRIYIFDLRADWYRELTEIEDELEMLAETTAADPNEDDGTMGGYFSRN